MNAPAALADGANLTHRDWAHVGCYSFTRHLKTTQTISTGFRLTDCECYDHPPDTALHHFRLSCFFILMAHTHPWSCTWGHCPIEKDRMVPQNTIRWGSVFLQNGVVFVFALSFCSDKSFEQKFIHSYISQKITKMVLLKVRTTTWLGVCALALLGETWQEPFLLDQLSISTFSSRTTAAEWRLLVTSSAQQIWCSVNFQLLCGQTIHPSPHLSSQTVNKDTWKQRHALISHCTGWQILEIWSLSLKDSKNICILFGRSDDKAKVKAQLWSKLPAFIHSGLEMMMSLWL